MLKKNSKPRQTFDFGGVYLFSLLQKANGMKGVMHYIWKSRLIPKSRLITTSGEEIKIIDTGKECENSNLFCNARLRIGDKEWSGNVILHHRSSDWEKELRSSKEGYDNVILHVTIENDCERLRKHGEAVHQLCISYPRELDDEFTEAQQHSRCLPCITAITGQSNINIHNYLSRLLVERIEEKAAAIEKTYALCDQRWEETLMRIIIRSFGFGIQGDIFEEWAKVLDLNALGKHRDNLLQVEAIMFGQAGLLDEESIPYYYRTQALTSEYYNKLAKEYRFLKNKFGLKEIDHKTWGTGSATPHVRIARIAALYWQRSLDFSSIAACETITGYYKLLDTTLHGYWSNHACFGGTETTGCGNMRQRQLDVIIINAIIPILYIYGKHRNDSGLCGKAEELLYQLKSEENSIVRKWKDKGIAIECAADSQAILQLDRRYCRLHNCTKCRFAYYYLKERITSC